MWRKLFQGLWKTFEFDFGGILRRMHDHMNMIQHQATIAQFAEITGTHELLKLKMKQEKEIESRRRRDVVRQWLSAANCEADQETYASVRHKYPSTTQWLFQINRFNSWFDPMYCSTHLLWISGIPGAG